MKVSSIFPRIMGLWCIFVQWLVILWLFLRLQSWRVGKVRLRHRLTKGRRCFLDFRLTVVRVMSLLYYPYILFWDIYFLRKIENKKNRDLILFCKPQKFTTSWKSFQRWIKLLEKRMSGWNVMIKWYDFFVYFCFFFSLTKKEN